MKSITTAKLTTIARLFAKENPEQFRAMCAECEPMLLPRHTKLIPQIHQEIKKQYPYLDKFEESILLTAATYHAFAPGTMLGDDIERAPNGIRQEMCNVMEWKDAPTANYYQKRSMAYFKGKTFREKVMSVLSPFQRYSVKPQQIELF